MVGLGWIMAIIIGGIAGVLAEKLMKSNMGLLANIALGIIGAVVFNFLLGLLGIGAGVGLIGNLIVATLGACLLIAVARMIRGTRPV